jgi:hypothetical protein
MARLNIETKVAGDLRFQKLLIKLGDRHKAKGMLWELWELAQKHWFPNRDLIPENEWLEAELSNSLVELGFADKREKGYYARGSEEHFAWLFGKQEAGRKGGLARNQALRKEKRQAIAKHKPSNSKASLLLTPFSLLSSHNSV